MTSITERRLLLVTGKGGTGKTTIAAALAQREARRGRKVLLCELDTAGDIGDVLGVGGPRFEPMEVERNLSVMRMDTQAALSEYLELNLKLPLAVRAGPFAKAFDFVATAAPGVREVLTIGKLCWEVKRENYDLVVADAPATGHVVSQLTSPDAIGGLVNVGPLTGQTAWMREMLSDPTKTGVVVVTTPEEIPVTETATLIERLKNETNTPLGAVVVNRSLPELFNRADDALYEELRDPEKVTALAARVPGDLPAVFAAADLGRRLRRTQDTHITTLRSVVPSEVPLLFVPQSFDRLDGPSVVERAHDALATELDR